MKINNIRELLRRVTSCCESYDPFEIMAKLNIKLGFLPDDTDINKLKGCYGMVNGDKVILLHPDLNEYERREVCAHELGHALLHPTTNALFLATYTYFNLGKLELDADSLASELLIQDDTIYKYMGRNSEYISKCEKVSVKYVDIKINNLKKRLRNK